MPNSTVQLYRDAIRLPREAQILLVEKLLENIGENIDAKVEAAQIQEVREGKSTLIPGEEAPRQVGEWVDRCYIFPPKKNGNNS